MTGKLIVYYVGQDEPDRYADVKDFKRNDDGTLTFTGTLAGSGVTGSWTLSNTYKSYIQQ